MSDYPRTHVWWHSPSHSALCVDSNEFLTGKYICVCLRQQHEQQAEQLVPRLQVLNNSLEAHVLQSDNSSLAKDCRKDIKAANSRLLKLGRKVCYCKHSQFPLKSRHSVIDVTGPSFCTLTSVMECPTVTQSVSLPSQTPHSHPLPRSSSGNISTTVKDCRRTGKLWA